MNIRVRSIHPTLGAEVSGISLAAPLDATTEREIESAWRQHGVLVFRDQPIDDAAHVAFSRRFGELEVFPQSDARSRLLPEVFRISNVDESGALLPSDNPVSRYSTLTWLWHSDSSYRAVPSKGAVLHGIEVVEEGGATLWADLRTALAAMPRALARRIRGLRAVHSFVHSRNHRELPPMKPEELALVPPVEHPLVRAHEGAAPSVYLSPSYMERIAGWSVEESRELLDELVRWCTQDRFVYRHQWRPHDVLMWDNRWTMHMVTPYDVAQRRRVMHRTAIAGTGPVLAAE
ncbi:MAG: TauD/TfdA family dioxygenase [Ectothiorhodospiraceae bacterium]|nr:TauD/TfdA family dioxygenase [Ectothiorhodospiraceae bacterium]